MSKAKKSDLLADEPNEADEAEEKEEAMDQGSDEESEDEDRPEGMLKFGDYDLLKLGVPASARPQPGQHHGGKHGYTLRSGNGAVAWFKRIGLCRAWLRPSKSCCGPMRMSSSACRVMLTPH